MKFELAKAVGAAATWALAKVAHRPAANFPGKAGLVVDPNLIAHLKPRVSEGTIVVVGTNGKTTVTNLLADVLEAYGKTVACNRTGANLDSGVASALLHAHPPIGACSRATSCGWPRSCPNCSPISSFC